MRFHLVTAGRVLILAGLASACTSSAGGSGADAGMTCRLPSDCPRGMTCLSGVCGLECREDRDCIALGGGTTCDTSLGVCRGARADSGLEPRDGAAPDGDPAGSQEFAGPGCGSDPTSNDWDGDGVPNSVEINALHTSPCDPDTDGDGMPDGSDAEPNAVTDPGGSCRLSTVTPTLMLAPGQGFLRFPLRVQAHVGNGWEYSQGGPSPFSNRGVTPLTHSAIDYVVGPGTPVYSGCDGYAVADSQSPMSHQAYGHMVLVRCDRTVRDAAGAQHTLYLLYGHLERAVPPMESGIRFRFHSAGAMYGRRVTPADIVGYAGQTGATWPHLHFQLYLDSYDNHYRLALDPYDIRARTSAPGCHSARWFPGNLFACDYTSCGPASLWERCPPAAECGASTGCEGSESSAGAYVPVAFGNAAQRDMVCSAQCPTGYAICGGSSGDPCAGVTCSGHGACSGGACMCAPQYAGPSCDRCAPGYTGYPTCSMDCGAQTNCGGRCVDTASDAANCGGCGRTCVTGQVCSGGRCMLSCAAGLVPCGSSCLDTSGTCSTGNPCETGRPACSSGTPRCTSAGARSAGTPCAGGVCNGSGTCVPCAEGAACATGNPCENGRVTCASGASRCVAGGSLPAGTACPGGVCDGSGRCNPCSAGGACDTGDPCRSGMTACGTGTPTCVPATSRPDGTSCGTGRVCQGGTCATVPVCSTTPTLRSPSEGATVAARSTVTFQWSGPLCQWEVKARWCCVSGNCVYGASGDVDAGCPEVFHYHNVTSTSLAVTLPSRTGTFRWLALPEGRDTLAPMFFRATAR